MLGQSTQIPGATTTLRRLPCDGCHAHPADASVSAVCFQIQNQNRQPQGGYYYVY